MRVTKEEKIMNMSGMNLLEMEAEDMTLLRWDRGGVTAEYQAVEAEGSSGDKALIASGSYPDDNKIADASNIYIPPLTFAMRSPKQQEYFFWVRAKVLDASQDSLWFNGGYLDNYYYSNMGINIGTHEQPWTWTKVGSRTLIQGIHSIGICRVSSVQ